jgi:hypothetical protein
VFGQAIPFARDPQQRRADEMVLGLFSEALAILSAASAFL